MRKYVLLLLMMLALNVSGDVIFMGLGDLPGGQFLSNAVGISGDGSTVVGYSYVTETSPIAFKWTIETGMVPLANYSEGAYLQVSSNANSASYDGSVIAGSVELHNGVNGKSRAIVWTDQNVSTIANDPFYTGAGGINDDGTVVVGSSYGGESGQAFRWTQETGVIGLGDFPGGNNHSDGSDVSANGNIVVGSGFTGTVGSQAFRWTQETGLISLGDLPGGAVASNATAISGDGRVIVGNSETLTTSGSSAVHAYRWNEETGMIDIDGIDGVNNIFSMAIDVSYDGSVIVGGYNDGNSPWHAFYWSATTGMKDLQTMLLEMDLSGVLDGWILERALGVSADGTRIVGHGINPDGNTEAWLANISQIIAPIPEPSSFIMFGLMLVMLRWKLKTKRILKESYQ